MYGWGVTLTLLLAIGRAFRSKSWSAALEYFTQSTIYSFQVYGRLDTDPLETAGGKPSGERCSICQRRNMTKANTSKGYRLSFL